MNREWVGKSGVGLADKEKEKGKSIKHASGVPNTLCFPNLKQAHLKFPIP